MDDADKYAVAVETVAAEHAARRHMPERCEQFDNVFDEPAGVYHATE